MELRDEERPLLDGDRPRELPEPQGYSGEAPQEAPQQTLQGNMQNGTE
jgi:hypothetical protein